MVRRPEPKPPEKKKGKGKIGGSLIMTKVGSLDLGNRRRCEPYKAKPGETAPMAEKESQKEGKKTSAR